MDLQLTNKVAWVTGATGALGEAIVSALLRAGAVVYASSRNADRLQSLSTAVTAAAGEAPHTLVVDVTDDAAVQAGCAGILAEQKRIDIVINSTTLPIFGDVMQLSDADWEAVIQTKFMGYLRVMRAVLPHMVEQGHGSIVNVSGGGGKIANPVHLPGSSVNAAVNLLSKGLSNVYGAHNIRINILAPGPIESERLDRIAEASSAYASGKAAPPNVGATPLGRLGRPEEVADAALYLASERASFINGALVPVDGGRVPTI